MNNKFIRINRTDPHSFITGLFRDTVNLAANSLLTIAAIPPYFNLDEYFQTNDEADHAFSLISGTYWTSFLGANSIGQYAARKPADVFVYARNDMVYRKATPEEVQHDYNILGDLVKGPEITDTTGLSDTQATLSEFNKRYLFTGLPRLRAALLTVRIISRSGLPNEGELRLYKSQVDENCSQQEYTPVRQSYFILTAKKAHIDSARIVRYPCNENGELDPLNYKYLGELFAFKRQQRLMFFPDNDVNNKIDFSEYYWTGQE